MARSKVDVNPTYQELEAFLRELQAVNQTLRDQVRTLQVERDQALKGVELLTESLRRRGCCDHDQRDASF